MSQDELKLRVMRALESDPNMSQRDLAKHLGVSLGGGELLCKGVNRYRLD